MRMWLVDPIFMCRKHLIAEHCELHTFVGTIKKGTSLTGYVRNNLLESSSIQKRHDVLVNEMLKRGYKHNSPLNYQDTLNLGQIDKTKSFTALMERCQECRNRLSANVII